jgi:intergrase/recombinase
MQFIEPYKFREAEWTSKEIGLLIYVVKNIEEKNFEKIIDKLSVLSEKNGIKVLLEVRNISEYFSNIIKVGDLEAEKWDLMNKLLDEKSNNNNNNSSSESFNISEVYLEHKDRFNAWVFETKTKNYSKSVTSECSKLFSLDIKTILDIRKEINENKQLPPRANNSFRVFLNYLEEKSSISPILLNEFRVYVKGGVGNHVDKRVPTKDEILKSISTVKSKYSYDELMLYFLLLESGCRFEELKKLILEYDSTLFVSCGDFSYYKLFWKRGKKNAFILFFRTSTINYVLENLKKYQDDKYLERFKHWIQSNKNIESAKYLRKFSSLKWFLVQI